MLSKPSLVAHHHVLLLVLRASSMASSGVAMPTAAVVLPVVGKVRRRLPNSCVLLSQQIVQLDVEGRHGG